MENRRLRLSLRPIPVLIHVGEGTFQGEIRALAKMGAFVSCLELPTAGTAVRLAFRGGTQTRKIELRASVAWTTDEVPRGSYRYPGFGVKFDAWNSDYHEFFEALLFS